MVFVLRVIMMIVFVWVSLIVIGLCSGFVGKMRLVFYLVILLIIMMESVLSKFGF